MENTKYYLSINDKKEFMGTLLVEGSSYYKNEHYKIVKIEKDDAIIIRPNRFTLTVMTNLEALVSSTIKEGKIDYVVEVEPINLNEKKCNGFKVLGFVPQEECIKASASKALRLQNEKWNIPTVRIFQEKYPLAIISGSISLFLRGIKLNRSGGMDLDIILPYYDNIAFDKNDNDCPFYIEESNDKGSGNDFDNTYTLHFKDSEFDEWWSPDAIKIDVRVSPTQKYDVVEYQGAKYKCSKLLDVWEAKIRYAKEGNLKHTQDFYQILNNFKKK